VNPEADPSPATYGQMPSLDSPPRWKQRLMFPVKFLLGMVFCQFIAGSMLVIGWTFRFAQRVAWKTLWKRSPLQGRGVTFPAFLSSHADTQPHLHWPNWFLRQNFIQTAKDTGKWHVFTGLTASLRRNFWLGLQGIFCTSVLVLPPLVLLWFGWDYGWNMSFHKGYEQFYVGVSTALIGILAFTAAMFYTPMAQARQAVTADWKSFFQFRLVWQVVWENWAGCLGLAALIALLALPLNIMKVAPMYIADNLTFPSVKEVGVDELKQLHFQYLQNYFLWCSLYLLPAFVLMRVLAAKIYAIGLVRGLRNQTINPDDLALIEKNIIDRLELIDHGVSTAQSTWRKIATWLGTRVGRILSGILIFAVWLGFMFQLVVSEFLNYHTAGRGWLNQPLIQLPWFQYLPDSMKQPGQNILAAIFLVVLCAVARFVIKRIQAPRTAAPNKD